MWPFKHGHGAEPFEQRQCLRAIVRSPSPLRIHGPQRHVRKHHDRCARRQSLDVPRQPSDLLGTQIAQPAGLEIQHVHETDEMHAAVVEAVPPVPRRTLSVALQVLRARIIQDVVLARHVEHPPGLRLRPANHLVHGVELGRLRQMADVARVQQELRLLWQRVEPRNRFLKRRRHIAVRRFVEPHVAVADLREKQPGLARGAGERCPRFPEGR